MSEISERYHRLASAFAARVAGVPVERWSDPTPCSEWSARDLVAHVIESHATFERLVGRDLGDVPDVADDPAAAFAAASLRVQADLDDPVAADAGFDGFQGRSTFATAVDRFLCFDLIIHSWDLARATGQDEQLPAGDVVRSEMTAHAFGDALRSPGVCGPAVDVADSADAQTKLLAFLGRQA